MSNYRGTPQVLQHPHPSYVRIPPAAPGQEQPIAITSAEFHAVLDRDAWTRDRYEHRLGGQVVHSIDTLRHFHLRRHKAPSHAPVAQVLKDAITTVKAEMVPLVRLLEDMDAGLDHPQRLREALTSIEYMAAQLRAVCPDATTAPIPN